MKRMKVTVQYHGDLDTDLEWAILVAADIYYSWCCDDGRRRGRGFVVAQEAYPSTMRNIRAAFPGGGLMTRVENS